MAKTKKVQRYEVTTKLPADGNAYRLMEKKYNSLQELLSMEQKTRVECDETWDRFAAIRRSLIAGDITDSDWKSKVGEWYVRSLYNCAFPSSPEFEEINNAFMAEYDSREDLQEHYKKHYSQRYWVHNRYGKQLRRDDAGNEKYAERPDSFRMFNDVYDTTDARKERELARETPYLEGDLVMLRTPYVGHRDHDPYWVNPYSQAANNGQATPPRDQPRIGTVIAVTEELDNWRATKGSKILKVIWMGQEDIVNVQEKYVKWHMRPTYKNGLKARPTE